MKLLSLLAVLALTAGTAHAMNVDFSAFDADQDASITGHGHGRGKFAACAKDAWAATKPSDDQNKQAGAFCEAAKAVVDANKAAVKTAFHAVMAEWSKHPVSQPGVVAAEGAASTAFAPIKNSLRDTKISIINLLTQDQRTAFNGAFMECLHK